MWTNAATTSKSVWTRTSHWESPGCSLLTRAERLEIALARELALAGPLDTKVETAEETRDVAAGEDNLETLLDTVLVLSVVDWLYPEPAPDPEPAPAPAPAPWPYPAPKIITVY